MNEKLTISPRTGRRWVRLIAFLFGSALMGSSVAVNASPSERGEWESVVFSVGLVGLLVFVRVFFGRRTVWRLAVQY